MIQRIQTVFLFISFVLTGLLFFIPFANLITSEVYSFSLFGISSGKSEEVLKQPYGLTVLGALTTLLIFVIIFLFKKRKLQMTLTLIAIILSLALNAAMYYLTDQYHLMLTAGIKYSVVFVFPIIAAVLLFLAYRSIKKDEKLVRSLDRLR
jgi:hypothetical protein